MESSSTIVIKHHNVTCNKKVKKNKREISDIEIVNHRKKLISIPHNGQLGHESLLGLRGYSEQLVGILLVAKSM